MRNQLYSLPGALLIATALSSPTPTEPERLSKRQLLSIPSQITSESQIESIAAGLEEDAAVLSAGASILLDILGAIVPSPTPASIPDALSSVASVYAAHPTDFVVSALDLVLDGLTPNDIVDLALGESPIENSSNNLNPISPNPPIYPKKSESDAPYSVDENTLRSAIYIPLDFTYGKVPPVLLIPGTGATSGENFAPNFAKEFAGSDYADPVYVNIPGYQLADIQINSEYVAYAINYISAISGQMNVSMLSWSAGSLDGQWAMTYWPSTRSVVSDFVTISADFHGTVLAYLLCPGFPQIPCPPAVIQVSHTLCFGGSILC